MQGEYAALHTDYHNLNGTNTSAQWHAAKSNAGAAYFAKAKAIREPHVPSGSDYEPLSI